jgi:hypothetical protein
MKKFLLLIFLVSSLSCSKPKRVLINTELFCKNGQTILIKFVRASDLKKAITLAYANKKRLKTSENYTPVRLPDGRSFVIKISPEIAFDCDLVESYLGQVERDYIHHF